MQILSDVTTWKSKGQSFQPSGDRILSFPEMKISSAPKEETEEMKKFNKRQLSERRRRTGSENRLHTLAADGASDQLKQR